MYYRGVTIKHPPLKLKSAKCFSGGLISDQKFSKCWPGVLLLAKIWKSSKSDFLLDFPLDFLKFALKIPIFFRSALRAHIKLDKTIIIFVFLFALISLSSCYNTDFVIK